MSAAPDQVRTFAVTEEDDGIRLDRWFKRNLPEVSFGQISRWARTGQLRLDGKRATPARCRAPAPSAPPSMTRRRLGMAAM
jgi:23S rRNA pseudouridine955/2504/2580 synthase